ncbi:hypothetical protein [uncultured Demequina sp.]|uniref:hypothetical protein n=1 Tax=uncultured Demequina sp. TaxID=693499 RepID=UPI0025F5C13E|nr:hypothetical protein [uncultured Demequina sp.]
MLGLSLDKVLIVLVAAAVIIGPTRLPHYAHQLAEWTRRTRDALESMRVRAEREGGVRLRADEWRTLDPRRYDPRTIIRDALDASPSHPGGPPQVVVSPGRPGVQARQESDAHTCPACGGDQSGVDAELAAVEPAPEVADLEVADLEVADPEVAAPARPRRQRWVVVGGSSGHPIRRLVDVEDDDAELNAAATRG